MSSRLLVPRNDIKRDVVFADLMKNLRHENIISLIGVCMDTPMWLVMELAPLGEVRLPLL